jgi:aldehyde dehydrogenase (NAD+)
MTTQSADDFARVFALQSQHKWIVKRSSAEERKQKLRTFKAAVERNAEAIYRALAEDLRKPIAESAGEVSSVVADIDDALAHIDEWMRPVAIQPAPMFGAAKAHVMYESRGICLIFGAWNFPFQLLFEPLVPCLAAGNCAMLKPNELAPATSAVSTRIVREVLDECDVAIFEGGIDLAQRLLELPVDHIFFTGSPKVGRTVMASAAKHLASVTLELGGKCPAVVDDSADLAITAATLAAARCYNAGQVCLCPDVVWVPAAKEAAFLGALEEAVKKMLYSSGSLDKKLIGRMVDARNFARVKGYLDDALAKGAKIAFGGQTEVDDLTIHPTALTQVPRDARVLNEEIFGPVLPVMAYNNISDVYRFVQQRGKPLALYAFSNDTKFVDALLQNTSSGGVTVNGWATHWFEPQLPFGGVNESGIGAYHGVHGFRELSHQRSVFIQA